MTRTVDTGWIARWLDTVADGTATMSQRAITTIDAHGGTEAIVDAARDRSVHLLELTDDRGKTIVAASRSPFRILC